MLIAARNAFMTGKRLPYDAEVEYLESTGTQWIDTGFKPNGTSRVQIEVSFQALNTISSTYIYICGFNSPWLFAATYGTDLPSYIFYSSAGFTYTQNGVVIANNTSGNKFDPAIAKCNAVPGAATYPFPLGARINGSTGAVEVDGAKRIFSCKITNGGILVRDLIPVRVGQVGYMYDRVTGSLFGNQGTGDFVLGPDVLTRRVYRNQGTGAFGYGNDLKYPIPAE